MKKGKIKLVYILIIFLTGLNASGQSDNKQWTLQECIDQAMQKNISIQGKTLTNETNKINANQVKAERFPSVNATVSENFKWGKKINPDNSYGSYTGSNSTSLGVSTNLMLYNGFKTSYNIQKAQLNYEAGNLDVETLKETITLNVLNAYLQILYSVESVRNSEKQVESTTEQLALSEERLKLGAIAKSEYLQVKSQLATEKLTLANAQNQLAINKLTLMQLMEIPVTDSFAVANPNIDALISITENISSDSIYNIALSIKPQIKSAELNKKIAELSIKIANAGYQPTLSLSAGLNTGYQSGDSYTYSEQISNKLIPTVGLTLSIPIFQNRQVQSGVALAKIESSNAGLNETDTRNQLRKSIEQACVDYESAIIRFEASMEQYSSSQESFLVAQEKYNQGLLNSVDFIIQKTNLITSESELLQSKFNLVFNKKIIDFYAGNPLSL